MSDSTIFSLAEQVPSSKSTRVILLVLTPYERLASVPLWWGREARKQGLLVETPRVLNPKNAISETTTTTTYMGLAPPPPTSIVVLTGTTCGDPRNVKLQQRYQQNNNLVGLLTPARYHQKSLWSLQGLLVDTLRT
ncbi:hypothetical protein BaRGS_00004754, partial [Batillaria attramentaria]